MKVQAQGNITAKGNFRNARLLIIEDNSDHEFIISRAIEQCLPEVKPVFIRSKNQAVDYFQECQQQEWDLPKLIMLDLYLPEREDGWELLDYIRTMPTALGKVPVLLLSNSDDRTDIMEAYSRGCSSYSVKPRSFEDWLDYFQTIRAYWWETVTLPRAGMTLF